MGDIPFSWWKHCQKNKTTHELVSQHPNLYKPQWPRLCCSSILGTHESDLFPHSSCWGWELPTWEFRKAAWQGTSEHHRCLLSAALGCRVTQLALTTLHETGSTILKGWNCIQTQWVTSEELKLLQFALPPGPSKAEVTPSCAPWGYSWNTLCMCLHQSANAIFNV